MARKKTIAIVHYNTPELTEAAILSLRKTGTDWPVVVFDNSDTRPFKKKMKGVKVINNREGQVIDFEAELAKYPDKCWNMARLSNYGSAKHMMSVQKLWELVPDGFILLESDVLVVRNIEYLWDEEFAACGQVQWLRKRTRYPEPDRLSPLLCYMNVPKLVENGAKYFDPKRCWALSPGGEKNWANWYDTGAALLEDIIKTKPQLVARLHPKLHMDFVHYNGGSWRADDVERQNRWLKQWARLWKNI